MMILNRNELSLRQFWSNLKAAQARNEEIKIITEKMSVSELPYDLKFLLKKSDKSQGGIGVIGITPAEWVIILEIGQLVILLALIGTVVYMIRKKYRFRVERSKDGSIIIEGKPT